LYLIKVAKVNKELAFNPISSFHKRLAWPIMFTPGKYKSRLFLRHASIQNNMMWVGRLQEQKHGFSFAPEIFA